MKKLTQLLIILVFSAGFSQVAFSDQAAELVELGKSTFPEWLNHAEVVSAIKTQNSKHEQLSEAEIVSLDKQWRAETSASSKPLVDAILAKSLSEYLVKVKDNSAGVYTEIFVMDNKGLNVGQSDVTSDYWQGDEDKWQKTYPMGPNAVHVGEVEFDDSSQQFQSQVSMSVVDPASGQVIGAVTVGINIDAL